MTFFAVIGKNAPAFTVASFTISMHKRPCTWASPVTTPAEGAPPHSSYIRHATKLPSSKNSVPGSMSSAIRSRAVRRPFLCCAAMAFSPPPCRMISSSLRTCATISAMAFWLRSKRGESVFTLLWNGEFGRGCWRWSVILIRELTVNDKAASGGAQCRGAKPRDMEARRFRDSPLAIQTRFVQMSTTVAGGCRTRGARAAGRASPEFFHQAGEWNALLDGGRFVDQLVSVVVHDGAAVGTLHLVSMGHVQNSREYGFSLTQCVRGRNAGSSTSR